MCPARWSVPGGADYRSRWPPGSCSLRLGRGFGDKWHGVSDPDIRYRQRELDLWANDGVHDIFLLRSKVIASIRCRRGAAGFVEVETPVLHPIPGGATARPFVTHYNALHSDVYLRIATELYLKRCVVGRG